MINLLIRVILFLNRKWVKWPLLIIVVVGIAAAHLVMSAKYGNSEQAPTWKFTLTLHSALLVAGVMAVVVYKKFIKSKLIEYSLK